MHHVKVAEINNMEMSGVLHLRERPTSVNREERRPYE